MCRMRRARRIIFPALLLVLSASTSIVKAQPTPVNPKSADSKIVFKGLTADDGFSIAGDATQGSYAGDNKDSLKFSVESAGRRMSFKNNANQIVGYIKISDPQKWKVEDASGKDLFTLKKEADGHFKLKNAAEKTLYVVRSEAYGCKIEDGENATLGKVHKSDDKLSLKNKDGKEILTVKSSMQPIVLACFSFDALDKNQRAALAYAINFVRN